MFLKCLNIYLICNKNHNKIYNNFIMIEIIPEYQNGILNENNIMDVLIKIKYTNDKIIKSNTSKIYIYLDNSILSIGNDINNLKKYLLKFIQFFKFTDKIYIYTNNGLIYKGINKNDKIKSLILKVKCEGFNIFNDIF